MIKHSILIAALSCSIALTGCDKSPQKAKQGGSSLSSTQSEKEKNKKIELVQEFTGVWANNQNLISIVYQNDHFQFWWGNTQMIAKLGDIDLANETINILFSVEKNAPELILTVKRIWNSDKTSFTLEVTGEQSIGGEFKFIRKITNDDLNRFAKIAQQQANKTQTLKNADELKLNNESDNNQAAINQTPPTDAINAPNSVNSPNIPNTSNSPQNTVIYPSTAALTTNEVHKVARNYITQMLNDSSGESLRYYYAPSVDYYDKGVMTQNKVVRDKENYFNQWHSRRGAQSGALKISNGVTDNQKIVTFTYNFVVTDHEKEIRGKSIRYLTFEKMGNEVLIIAEKGKPLGSSIRRF